VLAVTHVLGLTHVLGVTHVLGITHALGVTHLHGTVSQRVMPREPSPLVLTEVEFFKRLLVVQKGLGHV